MQLRTAVRQVIRQGKLRAQQAVEREKVRTAWETGKLIHEHILLNQYRAEYGARVVERLAKDLRISKRELHYMVEFAREYPIVPGPAQLPWSHYRDLLAIDDLALRDQLARADAKEEWSQDKLRAEIKRRRLLRRTGALPRNDGSDGARNDKGVGAFRDDKKLSVPELGKPLDYPVIKAKDGPYQNKPVVDLGFSLHVAAKDGRQKLKGDPSKWPFTYYAWVIRVIDGDTLWARIDLGYGITAKQKLRLNHLNAPELPSRAGVAAKKFLMKHLKKGQKFLVLTTKSDQYDRYLADIFLEDGRYLNGIMAASGHAQVVD